MLYTKKLLFFFIFFGCYTVYAQENKGKEVLTIFTFAEVEKLHQQNPKPIVVFIYTDWCKICHGMKKTSFKNTAIIELLNEKFYFVKLNGEEKKAITFVGKTFVFKQTGANTGIHELANELASKKGRIAYPTTVILNSKFEIDLQEVGFLNSKKMKTFLNKYLNL
jgi:thioredoxin-related protein